MFFRNLGDYSGVHGHVPRLNRPLYPYYCVYDNETYSDDYIKFVL